MNELQAALQYAAIRRIIEEKYRLPSLTRADAMRELLITVLTNKGFEKLLKRYERRQSEAQFKNQIAITNTTLSSIGKRLVRRFVKAARVTGINKRVEIDGNEKGTQRLQEKTESFYEKQPVENYLLRFVDLFGLIDANAFQAVHFKPFAPGAEPVVYPVLYPCTQIQDFLYDETGILSYLIVRIPRTIKVPALSTGRGRFSSTTADVTDYIMYENGVQTVFTEWRENRPNMPTGGSISMIDFNVMGEGVRGGGARSIKYQVNEYKTNTNEVPAMRLGYETDAEDTNLCVSPIFAAEPHFRDYVQLKSDLDVTMKLHIYQRLFQYVEKCPGENPQQSISCTAGKKFGTNIDCSKCKGKGILVHDNGMDLVYLPMPDNPVDIVPLDKLAYYLTPDIAVVEKLENRINEIEYQKIPITIFGTELLQRVDGTKGVTKTATETNLNADQVSDTLRPFVQQRSLLYKFIVRQIALFNDLGEGLIVSYEYPSDLAVETAGELLAQLEQATKSGASNHVSNMLSDRLMRTMLRDKPRELLRYLVQERFMPMNGKTQEEKIYLLASDLVPKRYKVLYAMSDSIIDELVEEQQENRADFISMSYSDQNKMIDAKLKKFLDELAAEAPVLTLNMPTPKPAPVAA